MAKKYFSPTSIGRPISALMLVITSVGMMTDVQATPYNMSIYGASDCTSCHAGGVTTKTTGQAGLKAFLASKTTPTCTAPQVLKNNVCVTPINTKPVINAIALEWDAEADQALSIPLSVTDAEQDAFQVAGKLPSGSSLSTEYTASNGLPTVDFKWTPTAAQANKVYTVKFTAKETSTTKNLSSLPVTAKVRVWPAGNIDQAYVSNFMVSTTKWTADNLTLKGKVILNKLMTPAEKITFLSRTDLTVNITQGTDGTGAVISSSLTITLDPKNGNWILNNIALVAPFSCNVTVEFEDKLAARKITGAPNDCLK